MTPSPDGWITHFEMCVINGIYVETPTLLAEPKPPKFSLAFFIEIA